MSLLSVRGLTKQFGGVIAVEDVSFDVFTGTIKAIIGPNGAGKSTLFNLLTGYEKSDSGSVTYDGDTLLGFRPHQIVRRGIARTFQNTQLFEEMTAVENVLAATNGGRYGSFLSAAVRFGAKSSERKGHEQALHVLRRVGIEHWADTLTADIPHGVRRSLEIARALATQPGLLLLDEPAAGLNASETRALGEALYRIRDEGTTIVIVEHDVGLVMEVSEEIVVLDRGQKIAEGSPLLIQKDARVIEAYLGEEVAGNDV